MTSLVCQLFYRLLEMKGWSRVNLTQTHHQPFVIENLLSRHIHVNSCLQSDYVLGCQRTLINLINLNVFWDFNSFHGVRIVQTTCATISLIMRVFPRFDVSCVFLFLLSCLWRQTPSRRNCGAAFSLTKGESNARHVSLKNYGGKFTSSAPLIKPNDISKR